MRRLWVHQDVDAPAELVWTLLCDLERWPEWGPSVRHAELASDQFGAGARGTITTAIGARLGFEITDFDDGHRWSWQVAGIPATDHTVDRVDDDRCRIGFGVPWIAAPYVGVCRVASHRIARLAAAETVAR